MRERRAVSIRASAGRRQAPESMPLDHRPRASQKKLRRVAPASDTTWPTASLPVRPHGFQLVVESAVLAFGQKGDGVRQATRTPGQTVPSRSSASYSSETSPTISARKSSPEPGSLWPGCKPERNRPRPFHQQSREPRPPDRAVSQWSGPEQRPHRCPYTAPASCASGSRSARFGQSLEQRALFDLELFVFVHGASFG